MKIPLTAPFPINKKAEIWWLNAIFLIKGPEQFLKAIISISTIGFGVLDPPQAPKKTYIYEMPQIMLKFGNFQKSRVFLGGQRVFLGFEPSKMFLYMIIYYFRRIWGKKMPNILTTKKCHF